MADQVPDIAQNIIAKVKIDHGDAVNRFEAVRKKAAELGAEGPKLGEGFKKGFEQARAAAAGVGDRFAKLGSQIGDLAKTLTEKLNAGALQKVNTAVTQMGSVMGGASLSVSGLAQSFQGLATELGASLGPIGAVGSLIATALVGQLKEFDRQVEYIKNRNRIGARDAKGNSLLNQNAAGFHNANLPSGDDMIKGLYGFEYSKGPLSRFATANFQGGAQLGIPQEFLDDPREAQRRAEAAAAQQAKFGGWLGGNLRGAAQWGRNRAFDVNGIGGGSSQRSESDWFNSGSMGFGGAAGAGVSSGAQGFGSGGTGFGPLQAFGAGGMGGGADPSSAAEKMAEHMRMIADETNAAGAAFGTFNAGFAAMIDAAITGNESVGKAFAKAAMLKAKSIAIEAGLDAAKYAYMAIAALALGDPRAGGFALAAAKAAALAVAAGGSAAVLGALGGGGGGGGGGGVRTPAGGGFVGGAGGGGGGGPTTYIIQVSGDSNPGAQGEAVVKALEKARRSGRIRDDGAVTFGAR